MAPALSYEMQGERLLHRLPHGMVSYHLPSSSVLAALMFDHSSPKGFRLWRLFLIGLSLALIYALCAALGAPWAGVPVNALLLAMPRILYVGTAYVHLLLSLWTLLIAGLLAWRERNPTLGRSAAVGLAIGSSLLFRSVFAFFPPIAALTAAYGLRKKRAREILPHVLLLGALPYLFLLPWVHMNWLVHRELVLFERGESIGLIVMSALGFVGTDYRGPVLGDRAVDEVLKQWSAPPGMSGVMSWAILEVLAHPLRFAYAYAARAGLIASQHPLLFALGAAMLVAYRRKREFVAAGLVAAYFIGVHCFLPYYDEYYSGLWVLLAVIVCSGGMLAAGPRVEAAWESRAARAGLFGGLSLALALSVFTIIVIERYAFAMPRRYGPALEQALQERPDERWLLAEAGMKALEEQRLPEADKLLRRALDGGFQYPRWKLYSAWVRALLGDPKPLMSDPALLGQENDPGPYVMRAHAQLKHEDAAAARRELMRGLHLNEESLGESIFKGVDGPIQTLLVLQRRRLMWRALEASAFEVLDSVPDHDRAAFLLALLRAGRDVCAQVSRLAEPSVQSEVRLFCAEVDETRWEWSHRAALAHQYAGECRQALRIFDRLCRERPLARYFSDRAVCQSKTGATAKATADLQRALRMDPGFLSAYISFAAIYAQSGRYREAVDVCDRGLSQPPEGQAELRGVLLRLRSEMARRSAGQG